MLQQELSKDAASSRTTSTSVTASSVAERGAAVEKRELAEHRRRVDRLERALVARQPHADRALGQQVQRAVLLAGLHERDAGPISRTSAWEKIVAQSIAVASGRNSRSAGVLVGLLGEDDRNGPGVIEMLTRTAGLGSAAGTSSGTVAAGRSAQTLSRALASADLELLDGLEVVRRRRSAARASSRREQLVRRALGHALDARGGVGGVADRRVLEAAPRRRCHITRPVFRPMPILKRRRGPARASTR